MQKDENRHTDQPVLPIFEHGGSNAEACFLKMSRRWFSGVSQTSPERAVSRECDLLALSCLLLLTEFPDIFSAAVQDELRKNTELAARRRQTSWMDELTWGLCWTIRWSPPTKNPAIRELIANLDHHNSSIRGWMLEMAWFARKWLSAEECIGRLLENVASSIRWPTESAGLAITLVADADEFYEAAEAYVPQLHSEQYGRRLERLHKVDVCSLQSHFWNLECQCRKTIGEVILPLPFSNPE